MTKIKICGLTREQDIDIVNRALPDYIGFVFAESRRQIRVDGAKKLAKLLQPVIKSVGVFVDCPVEEVNAIANECNLKAVQLHGHEDFDYLVKLRGLLPSSTQIIKAIRVKDRESILSAAEFPCDLFLFDAYCENMAGGSGKSFNWELLKAAGQIDKPYFLAGGLSLNNIQSALHALHPYAVDISSGAETDGVKDEGKIKNIIQLVRHTEIHSERGGCYATKK